MSVPSFSAVMERYREHLQYKLERRPTTIAGYSGVLWDWYGWLDRRGKTWDRATDTDAARWLQRPTRSGRARGVRINGNTRMHYLNALRGFYRFAEQEKLIARGRNPTAGLVAKGSPPVPRAIPVADLRTALVAAEHDTRLEVMVALGYFAGMRTAEIAAARLEDLHLDDQPRLLVHGKGGKDRVIPLHPECERVIRRHLARVGRRVGPLVAGRGQSYGRAMTGQSVSRALSEHLRALGIDGTAHSLRHSAATEMLRAAKGRNLEDVRAFLGHSDTRTTRRYILAYPFDVAAAVAACPTRGGAVRDIAARVPWEVRAELDAAVAILEEHGPKVAAALETLGRLTTEAWWASMVPASLDPAEDTDTTDEEWERLEAVTGIRRGWEVADVVARAAPD